MTDFYQAAPQLNNQYEYDSLLRAYLAWKLPTLILQKIEPDLNKLGQRVITDIYHLGIEAEMNPPQHIPYDAWGRRIDHIKVACAWQQLDKIAAQEKLVAIAYERKYAEYSRIYQFAKLYLFHPSSAIYTCPLAMTDGAARALELYGGNELKQRAFKHLTSSDPAQFWTSGQWMTERSGGSDVSQTMTIAKKDHHYFKLYGIKWFTSATTSQMAMTLARIEGAPEGSKGLSLFYLELKDEEGNLNGISINRLKDKLGTRALPTAELSLNGAKAYLVGEEGKGVKKISALFNITRIYNACSALGYMRRAIVLASDYAKKRQAFGKLLSEHPLHIETLANMQLAFQASFHLVFHAVELLGKEELGVAQAQESATLRLLTPIIKLYTAKQAIQVVSEALECFGGAGYIEDTGLPKLLRDTQVLSIWEGTTNVLSLDVLRAINKEKTAVPFLQDMIERLSQIQAEELNHAKQHVQHAISEISEYLSQAYSKEFQEMGARELAFSLARTYAAALLLEFAEQQLKTTGNKAYVISAQRWCNKKLVSLIKIDENYKDESKLVGMST